MKHLPDWMYFFPYMWTKIGNSMLRWRIRQEMKIIDKFRESMRP
jgi:hypothetical protein